MSDVSPELTPGLKAILSGLEAKGRAGKALAAGLDFVFHNWTGLIDEGGFDEDSLWEILESYSETLGSLRRDVLAGLGEAAGKPPHALPPELALTLSAMDNRDVHEIAAADTARALFSSWTQALAAGDAPLRLGEEYSEAQRLLATASGPAREALKAAVAALPPSP